METAPEDFRDELARLVGHFPRRRRWQALVILALMGLSALAELVTIGAIVPFLAVIADASSPASLKVARVLGDVGLGWAARSVPALAGLFAAAVVTAAAIRIFLMWASQKFVFRLGFDLGVTLYRRILYQPYAFHVSLNSSRILSMMGRVQTVVTGVLMPVLQGATSLMITVFIFSGMLFLNPMVAIGAGLGFGGVYLGVSIATKRRLRANSRIITMRQNQRLQTLQEGLGGIRDVLIDHTQPIYVGKFAQIDTELRDSQAMNAMIAGSPRLVIEGAGMVLIAFVAVLMSRQEGGIMYALPVLGAFAIGAQRLLPLLQQMYNGWTTLASNRFMFTEFLKLLDRPLPPDHRRRHRVRPLPFERVLRFERLSFRYLEEGPDVLQAIDIEIAKGARVGFVGKTGSGKSTLTDIAMGLLQAGGGAVTVDGVPLTAANIPAWQAQIAHVPQHIYLSDASVMENIAFGQQLDEIDEARVREAAWKADIGAFIEEQPDGYRTHVGERGVRLSGGQRQRIGIARALYKRASVLIFDEATSALDDTTEAAVMEAIDRLGPELTVLIIAHRTTTLRNCDMIYRLERGRVIERGPYAEVIQARRKAVAG